MTPPPGPDVEGEDDGEPVVGSIVLVNKKDRGTVKYAGPVEFDDGYYIGVELDPPAVGDCDGTVEGKSYFTCRPNGGVLVPVDMVVMAGAADSAAGRVQGLGRKLLARRKLTKERNSKVWNKLDNMNEQLAIKRSIQLQSIFNANQEPTSREVGASEENIEIEDSYAGPHITFPMTEESVLSMLEHFKSGDVLHAKYSLQLLMHVKEMLGKEGTLQEIAIEPGSKMTVVGDTHGQLQDLFSIFTINGLPSPTNMYLFNGDFVDRGTSGCEVYYCMCAFKVMYPNAVFLNRGNHETRQQNRLMGFEEEVLTKYKGQIGRVVLSVFHSTFDCLPLCALIQGKIFVVHGGLFHNDGVTLDHLRGMSRKREPPIHSDTFEDQLFEAMLWSDPRPIQGRQMSSRGAGVEFGMDVTHEFLRNNSLALVIRSHECVREGFELVHNGRLITLFSASRYGGLQTNKGAFLTIGPELQPEIQQFYAHSVSDTHWDRPGAQTEAEQRLEDDAVAIIVERLLDQKPSLYWHFTRQDKDKTGTVTRLQWAKGLKLVLQLDVPFLSYLDRLADVEPNGTINYAKFLERYRVEVGGSSSQQDSWGDNVVDAICEKLFVVMGAGDINQAFKYFDHDGSGTIEYEEFVSTLKRLDIGLSDIQIFEMMRGLDQDSDSVINLEEFASRFEIVFTKINAKTQGQSANGPNISPDNMETMKKLMQLAYSKFKSLDESFAALSGGNREEITVTEFATKVQEWGLEADESIIKSIGTMIDENNDGIITKANFMLAFKVMDRRGSTNGRRLSLNGKRTSVSLASLQYIDEAALAMYKNAPSVSDASDSSVSSGQRSSEPGWQDSVVQSIANFLFQNRHQLAGAFRSFDANNDGSISMEEFRAGMMSMNTLLSSPVTELQIQCIMQSLDKDRDGSLSYKEFMDGFKIVDTKTGLDSTPKM